MAWGAGPSYSAAGIVNASNYSAGPFAPGSVVTIFGSGLARSAASIPASDNAAALPFELNYARVYVQDQVAPVLFVSPGQINFVVPYEQPAGAVNVRVVTEGISGPEVVIQLGSAAPALFAGPDGYALATNAAGKLLTADAPAHAGEIIVIYATGLGRTSPQPATGEIPHYAGQMTAFPSLKITLAGRAVDPMLIKYAGLTPGYAALYQINLEVPANTDPDPQTEVSAGVTVPSSGLKLPIR